MAWEPRGKGGKLTFYLSARAPDGRVVKTYLGTGLRAERAAAEVDARRRAAEADRLAVQKEIARHAATDALAAELVGAATVLSHAVLLAGGWRRSNFGAWRKSRHG